MHCRPQQLDAELFPQGELHRQRQDSRAWAACEWIRICGAWNSRAQSVRAHWCCFSHSGPTRQRPSAEPAIILRSGTAHGALARLAKEHPEVDVLIRPKPRALINRTWKQDLQRAFQDWGVDPGNLAVQSPHRCKGRRPRSDPCPRRSWWRLNSTTLIEAAIAGLPVILSQLPICARGASFWRRALLRVQRRV